MSGAKIIKALKEATAGEFVRVTIDGQVWVRQPAVVVADSRLRDIIWLADHLRPSKDVVSFLKKMAQQGLDAINDNPR